MTPTDQPQTRPHPRRDGWTPLRRQAFLEALAAGSTCAGPARGSGCREGAHRLRALRPVRAGVGRGAGRGARGRGASLCRAGGRTAALAPRSPNSAHGAVFSS